MTHRIARSAAALGLAAICLAGAASAETIAGRWKFRTDRLPSNGCIISGDIAFSPTPKAGVFSCAFVSQEDCVTASGQKTFQRVRQSCTASVSGDSVTITSKVETMLDAGPADMRARLMRKESYAPDDFAVALNASGDLVGQFHSLQKTGARFWRDADLVS